MFRHLGEHHSVVAQVLDGDIIDRLEQSRLVVQQEQDRVVRIKQNVDDRLIGCLPGDARHVSSALRILSLGVSLLALYLNQKRDHGLSFFTERFAHYRFSEARHAKVRQNSIKGRLQIGSPM
jgi:hypothetical protein